LLLLSLSNHVTKIILKYLSVDSVSFVKKKTFKLKNQIYNICHLTIHETAEIDRM
jgi:hypothetical protein